MPGDMIGYCGERKAAIAVRRCHAYIGCAGGSGLGYGDKGLRKIDAADPGAVPGGSTTNRRRRRMMTGPNQDRRVLKGAVFCSEWDHRDGPYTSANDNEALAIAA
jgi:hypothetical protein